MAIRCAHCGAEYDVTLFTFGRGIRCDCGAWVDMAAGHRETAGPRLEMIVQPDAASVADDETVLAVCRTAYARIAAGVPENVSAAQLAIGEELRRAGFELDEDNDVLTAGTWTIMAVLEDGRTVQLMRSGEWVILRNYV